MEKVIEKEVLEKIVQNNCEIVGYDEKGWRGNKTRIDVKCKRSNNYSRYDPNLSAKENMRTNRYYELYDAGNLKLEYIK